VADPRVFVTTSWDDGHELDTKMAALLADHGCPGTFYVSPRSREILPERRISNSALQELSGRFEVGCHTLTHPHLTRLSPSDAAREITDGKNAIEDVLGQTVSSFCYPYGAYGPTHVEMVRAAGFRVGRTSRRFSVAAASDPLQMSTTTHAARYKRDLGRAALRIASPRQAIRMWRDWDVLALNAFEEAYACGGVIHIWGHSWEVEENGDWQRLSRLLSELAARDDVTMLTNGQLGEHMAS
jgi:peptidoglycan/xylan/chitin deacetylase (PgdA/CDA1 family)